MRVTSETNMFEVPEAFREARVSLPDEIVIIASVIDEKSCDITIQDFIRDGRSYIPVFRNEEEFDRETANSAYSDSGMVINTDLFFSIMRGGEWLIVDPLGQSPLEIRLPPR